MDRLNDSQVLNWLGSDKRQEIAEYIATALCKIERGEITAKELIDEILEYNEAGE